jgi:hypothetical protein
MRSVIRAATALAFALGISACSDSSTDPGDDVPIVERISSAASPTAPAGTVARCYTAADGLTISPTCPVISWRGVTYWIFAYQDASDKLLLVAYDDDDDILFQSERQGIRQLYEISIDENDQTVTLFGLNGNTQDIPWSALEIDD